MERIVIKRPLASEDIPPLISDPREALEVLRKSSNGARFSIPMPMNLHPDVHEFIALCLLRKVEFLLAGSPGPRGYRPAPVS